VPLCRVFLNIILSRLISGSSCRLSLEFQLKYENVKMLNSTMSCKQNNRGSFPVLNIPFNVLEDTHAISMIN
jgi:hypothetical protein